MEFNINNYEILRTKKCDCGHEFTIKDMTNLKRLNIFGFYGNVIKHYSHTQCPMCHKSIVLLLKQKGQTYEVIDIAKPKATETKIETEPKNNLDSNFICPICQKACKNQLGLNAHLRTHKN